jgi:hypothetical protein
LATTCHFEIGEFLTFLLKKYGKLRLCRQVLETVRAFALYDSIWQALDLGNMNQDATSILDLTSLGAGHTASQWAVV